MVTGSHISADRNGLKFYRPDGEIDKGDEAAISAAEARMVVAPPPGERGTFRADDAVEGYVARALAMLEPGAFSGMRVGVYQHSSVARDMLVDILEALGAEVVPFGRSDIFVPVDTEALEERDAERCRAAAGAHGLDAIVSTDGDADRPLVADEAGAFLRGDLVGAVTADLLGAGCVVTPITSNSGIERCGRFSQVVRTRIGSPHVIEAIAVATASGAGTVVGFEASGGVLVGTDASVAGRRLTALPTRDALVPILAVLWIARHQRIRLSALGGRFCFRPAAAARLQHVPTWASDSFVAELRDDAAFRMRFTAGLLEAGTLDTTDGVRLKGGDGTVLHYRASGNAPELRCYVEADTAEAAATMLAEGLARAKAHLEEATSV